MPVGTSKLSHWVLCGFHEWRCFRLKVSKILLWKPAFLCPPSKHQKLQKNASSRGCTTAWPKTEKKRKFGDARGAAAQATKKTISGQPCKQTTTTSWTTIWLTNAKYVICFLGEVSVDGGLILGSQWRFDNRSNVHLVTQRTLHSVLRTLFLVE